MISTECPTCGTRVSAFAGSCTNCGATNAARTTAIAVTAALAVLVVAALLLFWILRPQGSVQTPPGDRTAQDFTWLSNAMDECDTDAQREENVLHFMVIPLTVSTGDAAQWRRMSLNDIGNAILLPSDRALESLKGGSLTVSSERYLFAMRDERSGAIYRWSQSVGVKRFSTADAESVEHFKIQFLTDARSSEVDWGATFVRRKGNCYWVNAILGL